VNQTIDVREQLQLLKAMTVRTGSIHEAQVLQLKSWPMLIQNVTKAKAKVDVKTKLVVFDCESTGTRATKLQKKLFESICEWTRSILWNETTVRIIINGKVVFDSTK